jgi:hypothetical protein
MFMVPYILEKDGRIILKLNLKQCDKGECTGLLWLRIRTNGGGL